jgi:hypothetical protein
MSVSAAAWRALQLAAAAAAVSCATSAAGAEYPGYCIVGESVMGCRSERALAQITDFDGDVDALRGTIQADLEAGTCRFFDNGESVFVRASVHGRREVRRPGDSETYWMPASWSRPIHECSGYGGARSIEEKLGLTLLPMPASPAAFSVATQPSRPPRSTCLFKPVMSDAEIEACRKLSR